MGFHPSIFRYLHYFEVFHFILSCYISTHLRIKEHFFNHADLCKKKRSKTFSIIVHVLMFWLHWLHKVLRPTSNSSSLWWQVKWRKPESIFLPACCDFTSVSCRSAVCVMTVGGNWCISSKRVAWLVVSSSRSSKPFFCSKWARQRLTRRIMVTTSAIFTVWKAGASITRRGAVTVLRSMLLKQHATVVHSQVNKTYYFMFSIVLFAQLFP